VVNAVVAALLVLLAACAPTPAPRTGDYHGSDADVSVTRLGHAGVLLEIGGRHFLLDPWLYDGTFVRQGEALGLRPEALPAASAVLVTGDDGTRLDSAALRQLAPTVPRLIAPQAVADRFAAGSAFRSVLALGWWQGTAVDGVRITAVPADGNGYLLHAGSSSVFVAGEASDAAVAAEVRRTGGAIDVLLVPIGERRVFGMRRGLGPDQAAARAAAVGARRVIPSAYGARGVFPFVSFAGDPLPRFRTAAASAGLPAAAVVVLEPGESWHYYR
jgi:L-ascorbate metabolism protein UlaG (beta-lactamase superfamily)